VQDALTRSRQSSRFDAHHLRTYAELEINSCPDIKPNYLDTGRVGAFWHPERQGLYNTARDPRLIDQREADRVAHRAVAEISARRLGPLPLLIGGPRLPMIPTIHQSRIRFSRPGSCYRVR
jgi:hypothetical protein